VTDASHLLRVLDDIERDQADQSARQVQLLSAAAYTPEPARSGVLARIVAWSGGARERGSHLQVQRLRGRGDRAQRQG
jgi:hypothetical protein